MNFRSVVAAPDDTIADVLPKTSGRVLAMIVAVMPVVFFGASWEYVIGLAFGILITVLLAAHDSIDDVHPWYVRAWIRGAHRAHGGDSRYFTIEKCTEPECEEGSVMLGLLERRER